jgi:MoxR-like ATPase
MQSVDLQNAGDAPLTTEQFCELFHQVRRELGKVIIGQHEAIEHLLVSVFAGGHVLLSGMPGLGRTLIVKTLAAVLGLEHRRLQFTPDLLPTDIVGTEVLEHHAATGRRRFRFFKGPVFCNMLLVDEINRSPTRTQSALLEVMQERQVTVGGQTFHLPQPFTLIATENTLDTEGIWRLGEAQVDRFMMSIEQRYPGADDERRMLRQSTGSFVPQVERIATPEIVLAMQALAREVPVVPSVRDFALAVVRASRPGEEGNSAELNETVRLGASPRAAQALLLGAKVTALARGRSHVKRQDVVDVAVPVLSHRLLIDFRAQAAGLRRIDLIDQLLEAARRKTMPAAGRWTSDVLQPLP